MMINKADGISKDVSEDRLFRGSRENLIAKYGLKEAPNLVIGEIVFGVAKADGLRQQPLNKRWDT